MSEEINREESRGRVASLHVADRFRAMFGERVEPRATPETDAAWDAYGRHASELRDVYGKMQEIERERDNLRERLELAMAANKDVERIARERDEALSRTEGQWLLHVATRLVAAGCVAAGIVDALDELVKDRDEARDVVTEVVGEMGEMSGLIRAALADLGCVRGLEPSDTAFKRGAMKLLEQALQVGCEDQRDGIDRTDLVDEGGLRTCEGCENALVCHDRGVCVKRELSDGSDGMKKEGGAA